MNSSGSQLLVCICWLICYGYFFHQQILPNWTVTLFYTLKQSCTNSVIFIRAEIQLNYFLSGMKCPLYHSFLWGINCKDPTFTLINMAISSMLKMHYNKEKAKSKQVPSNGTKMASILRIWWAFNIEFALTNMQVDDYPTLLFYSADDKTKPVSSNDNTIWWFLLVLLAF